MFQFIAKFCVAMLLLVSMLAPSQVIYAEETSVGKGQISAEKETTAEEMVLDLILLRPAGFIGMVLGLGAFVVSLPFTIPAKQVEEAGQKFVADPAKYTFARPLGRM